MANNNTMQGIPTQIPGTKDWGVHVNDPKGAVPESGDQVLVVERSGKKWMATLGRPFTKEIAGVTTVVFEATGRPQENGNGNANKNGNRNNSNGNGSQNNRNRQNQQAGKQPAPRFCPHCGNSLA